jgi:hypothetical protein
MSVEDEPAARQQPLAAEQPQGQVLVDPLERDRVAGADQPERERLVALVVQDVDAGRLGRCGAGGRPQRDVERARVESIETACPNARSVRRARSSSEKPASASGRAVEYEHGCCPAKLPHTAIGSLRVEGRGGRRPAVRREGGQARRARRTSVPSAVNPRGGEAGARSAPDTSRRPVELH